MKEQTGFGSLLKRYRMAAGLSQEGLAARASLSTRAISDLERGINRVPRYDTLELLTKALSLSSPQSALLRAYPASVFAIGNNLILLPHELLMAVERPWVVIRGYTQEPGLRAGRAHPEHGPPWRKESHPRRENSPDRKQFDPEHEIQLMLRGPGHRVNKAAFLFDRGIGFNQFLGGIAALDTTINSSIYRGHSTILFSPQILFYFLSIYAILPLRYLSSTKRRKRLGLLSAKVSKNCRFLHLLRCCRGRPS
jgi:transcriptional regulator with XRE-family HTH domain